MTKTLIPFILQSIILGHLWCGLLLALGMARKPRYRRGVLHVTWRPWVARRWRYSTTIGHGIALHPDHENDTSVIEHEFRHVMQYEDLCMLGCVTALALHYVNPWVALGFWASSGAPWMIPNFITALLRYGPRGIYRGALHEQAARREDY